MTITHEEWVDRADRIGQKAQPEVAAAEKSGCFSLELRDFAREMELHKLLRPVQYGGYGAGARTFSEIVRTIATYNASAAWICYFVSLHEQWVAFLPPEGRQEIYDSDGFVGDVFFPMGKIEYVDGGVKMSGQWQFASGVLWDEWMGLGAFVKLPGTDSPQPCLVTVKTSELDVLHDWNPFGMRGTGSHSVRVENVVVPWRRILPVGMVKKTGEPVGGHYSDEPIFRVPFMPFFCLGFAAISVGAGQRVIRDLKTRTKDRQRVLFDMKEWESPVAQRNIAEQEIKLHSLEAMNERYITQLEAWEAANTPRVSELESGRMHAWRSFISRGASEIAFKAMDLLGASSTASGDPLEIAARDLFMVNVHLSQIYEDNLVAYGRTLYDLPGHPLL